MLKFWTLAALAFSLALTAPAVTAFAQEHEAEDTDNGNRFAIFQGNVDQTPATILIDSATGRTWTLALTPDGGAIWVAVSFLDLSEDGRMFLPPAHDQDGDGEGGEGRERDRD